MQRVQTLICKSLNIPSTVPDELLIPSLGPAGQHRPCQGAPPAAPVGVGEQRSPAAPRLLLREDLGQRGGGQPRRVSGMGRLSVAATHAVLRCPASPVPCLSFPLCLSLFAGRATAPACLINSLPPIPPPNPCSYWLGHAYTKHTPLDPEYGDLEETRPAHLKA